MESLHLITFNIAGFAFYSGVDIFQELVIGTELSLVAEPENRHDSYAVAVYYGKYKLGFVPKQMNKDLNKYLMMGYEDIYITKINRIAPTEHPESQIGVLVRIKEKVQPDLEGNLDEIVNKSSKRKAKSQDK